MSYLYENIWKNILMIQNEFEGLTPHSQSVFGINQLNVKKYHDFNLMINEFKKIESSKATDAWDSTITEALPTFRAARYVSSKISWF